MIRELAPAKVNLVLHVGGRRADGLHELCSLFASVELADLVEVEARTEGPDDGDRVDCPGVKEDNLAAAALEAYRRVAGGGLPSLGVRIDKRIPLAAGLGGGSADAAAVLRAADSLAPRPLGGDGLRRLARELGADVPSQVEPGHALVTGAGERVEPLQLPPMHLVLVPQDRGLSTAAVYAEADRIGSTRPSLHPQELRELAEAPSLAALAPALENDLEPAALSLRPELANVRDQIRGAGAEATFLSGSGPTFVGAFSAREAAQQAAAALPRAIVTGLCASSAATQDRADLLAGVERTRAGSDHGDGGHPATPDRCGGAPQVSR